MPRNLIEASALNLSCTYLARHTLCALSSKPSQVEEAITCVASGCDLILVMLDPVHAKISVREMDLVENMCTKFKGKTHVTCFLDESRQQVTIPSLLCFWFMPHHPMLHDMCYRSTHHHHSHNHHSHHDDSGTEAWHRDHSSAWLLDAIC